MNPHPVKSSSTDFQLGYSILHLLNFTTNLFQLNVEHYIVVFVVKGKS